MPKKRRIIILAGPNGAGKTTFAREYLQREAYCPDFVNVDLIAAGLSPFNPQRAAIQAGKIMLSEIKRRVRKGESFAFETTLSGHIYTRWIPEWRRAGYRVRLIFLSLPDAEMAIERVAARVAQGGHNVVSADVRRRFESGLRNLENVYRDSVNKWERFDNSATTPRLISENRQTSSPSLEAREALRALRRAAKRALELGLQTGTPVWVMQDGKLVDLTKEHLTRKKVRAKRSAPKKKISG